MHPNRDRFSVALVPHDSGAGREDLLSLQDCLGVRKRSDALHAVFHRDPDGSAALLRNELGIADARCRKVNLEEMFIELMGGQG